MSRAMTIADADERDHPCTLWEVEMDSRGTPSSRLEPLPVDYSPELQQHFEAVGKNLGFVPNSILIMQRKPRLVKAFAQMAAAVWDPDSAVDRGFKRLVAQWPVAPLDASTVWRTRSRGRRTSASKKKS
jgi:hypothetical protein